MTVSNDGKIALLRVVDCFGINSLFDRRAIHDYDHFPFAIQEISAMTTATLPADLLNSARTQTGESLEALSRKAPVLVVFLRHCGCTFAREALDDIAHQRTAIASAGVTIVIVHMQTDAEAQSLFARYQLGDLPRISDPEQKLYQAFDLQRGSVWQVMGPVNMVRAIGSILKGNMSSMPTADIFQLPGAFLVRDGQIVHAFRGTSSSERPDYSQLAGCQLK